MRHNKKTHYIGCFEIEEDAAKAVNSKCQELNIGLKNARVGVLDNKTFMKLKEKVIFSLNFFNHFFVLGEFYWKTI